MEIFFFIIIFRYIDQIIFQSFFEDFFEIGIIDLLFVQLSFAFVSSFLRYIARSLINLLYLFQKFIFLLLHVLLSMGYPLRLNSIALSLSFLFLLIYPSAVLFAFKNFKQKILMIFESIQLVNNFINFTFECGYFCIKCFNMTLDSFSNSHFTFLLSLLILSFEIITFNELYQFLSILFQI